MYLPSYDRVKRGGSICAISEVIQAEDLEALFGHLAHRFWWVLGSFLGSQFNQYPYNPYYPNYRPYPPGPYFRPGPRYRRPW